MAYGVLIHIPVCLTGEKHAFGEDESLKKRANRAVPSNVYLDVQTGWLPGFARTQLCIREGIILDTIPFELQALVLSVLIVENVAQSQEYLQPYVVIDLTWNTKVFEFKNIWK